MHISDEKKEKISMVLRRAGVKRAALFGSFARDQATRTSDLDILVEFEGGKTLLDLIALKIKLQKMLDMKIDIVTYQSLSPFLRDTILREQAPLVL